MYFKISRNSKKIAKISEGIYDNQGIFYLKKTYLNVAYGELDVGHVREIHLYVLVTC